MTGHMNLFCLWQLMNLYLTLMRVSLVITLLIAYKLISFRPLMKTV